MGRIKTTFIKNITEELLEKYGKHFTTDFEKNKQLLEKFVVIQSKKIRNQIAGYITEIMKKKAS
ncbi:MAG: 30S ribosomal protein S17e [Candidatus Aenigmarchaeota archaeon]|nr:30S ribosomal protein S17e [Candidatus Aenigmarchaeota archaeon]